MKTTSCSRASSPASGFPARFLGGVVLGFLLVTAGCADLKSVVAVEGAKAADEQLTVTTFVLCRAITVGAWMRTFGSDPEKAAAWRTLCNAPVTQVPADAK